MHQMCKWINYSKEPLIGYRKDNKTLNGEKFAAGQQYMLKAFDENTAEEGKDNEVVFDPNLYYIDVTLRPATVQDEQGQTNLAIQRVANLGVPRSKGMEMIGYEDSEALVKERAKEDFAEAYKQTKLMEIQAKGEAARILAEAQAQAQALIQQVQQQMQAQQQQQAMGPQGAQAQMNAGPAFEALGGQGFNPAAGGQSPHQVVPGMNRPQVRGETDTGEPTL